MTAAQITRYLDGIRDEYADPRALILPALRFAQGESGWLPPKALAAVAEATGHSQAYIESVASFYDRFHLEPVGERVINVCVTLSCMLRGSDALLLAFEEELGIAAGEVTPDGAFSLQPVQCLGACDRAPCLQIDAGMQQGPLTPDDVPGLVRGWRAAGPPEGFDR